MLVIGNLAHLHLLVIAYLLFQCIHNLDGSVFRRRFHKSKQVQCEDPGPLKNGISIPNRSNMMLDHYCFQGFKLIGGKQTVCIGGRWYGDRPICAKPGCSILPDIPEHGNLLHKDKYHIGLYCPEGYDLFGNRYAYCDGSNWDRPLGGCRKLSSPVSYECDFESSDLCGWTSEISKYFSWQRVMTADLFPSFHSGLRHDHTIMTATGGHYMMMLSFGTSSTPAGLSSPIYGRDVSLMTASCFQFHYFMYGAGLGNLNVYVKPVTKKLMEVLQDKENYLKFTTSGNRNKNWNDARFSIDEMEDDFQIVFVVNNTNHHVSLIAVDDVKFMTGTECKALDDHNEDLEDSAKHETTTTVNQTQINTNEAKHTWLALPKLETSPRGAIVLLLMYGIFLIAVLYRRRGQVKKISERKILQKKPDDEGAEHSNSVNWNIRHEDATLNAINAASGSTASNQLKLSLPSQNKSKPDERGSSGEHALCAENSNDVIPLL